MSWQASLPSTLNVAVQLGLLVVCFITQLLYLILATVDRILITSRNALTRRRSTRRLAFVSIVIGTIFWALFHCHLLIFTSILQFASNVFFCYFHAGVETIFVHYYTLMKEMIVLAFMILFDLQSVKNSRGVNRVAVVSHASAIETTAAGRQQGTSAKDRQLVFMLIVDIGINAIFSIIVAISPIYDTITENYIKSADRVSIENNLRLFCYFGLTIPCAVNCYANLFVSVF